MRSGVSSVMVMVMAAGAMAPVGARAWAQVVTPPPQEVTPIDWNIPKPPPAPTMPFPQQVESQAVRPAAPQRTPLPDLPYTSLVEKDENGKLKPLSEPMYLASMRRNPMLAPEYVASIQHILDQRQETAERLVVANLDIVEKIDDGMFENANFENRTAVQSLMNSIKPLVAGTKTLGEELKSQKLIEELPYRFNNKILMEYINAQVEERNNGERDPQKVVLALYKQNVDEFAFLYHQAMVTATQRFEDVVSGAALSDEARSKARAVGAQVAAAQSPADKLGALKALRESLSLDERRAFVERAIAVWKQTKQAK